MKSKKEKMPATGWITTTHPRDGKTHTAMWMRSPHGERVLVYMEDVIMEPRPDEYVEHLDGNTLNNQRHNLRLRKRPNPDSNS